MSEPTEPYLSRTEKTEKSSLEAQAKTIKAYWRERGYNAILWVEKVTRAFPATTYLTVKGELVNKPACTVTRYELRNNFINGMPPKKK